MLRRNGRAPAIAAMVNGIAIKMLTWVDAPKFVHGTVPATGTVLILPHVSRETPENDATARKGQGGWQQFLRPISPDTAPSWARMKPTRFAVSRSIRPSYSP